MEDGHKGHVSSLRTRRDQHSYAPTCVAGGRPGEKEAAGHDLGINTGGFYCTMEAKVGDVLEIKRVITVTEINHKEKQIKITWKDKVGKQREQWVTFNMFKLL